MTASVPAPAGLDPVAAHPHAAPTTYPLVLRTHTYAWWRPVVGLFVLVAMAVAIVPLLLLPLLDVGLRIQGDDVHKVFAKASAGELVSPASMLYLNLTLAAMVLITWWIVRYVHGLRPRWLMSVRPGVRWRFLAVCMGLSIIAMLAQLGVGALLPHDANDIGGHLQPVSGTLIAYIVVVVLTTPLQAMGEEYAFRGYAMQAFGSLTRSPWFAILLSSALFTAAHGLQNVPLAADRFAFGLLAGYLVYRTGGLEAGIGLHVWNNLVAFGFGIAYGQVQQELNEHSASWWNIPLTITQNGVYLLLVLWAAKRMGIDNRTRPPVLAVESGPV